MKTLKILVRSAMVLVLLAAASLQSGCIAVAAGAGAGAVAYIRGDLEATLGNPYEAVAKAADRAIGQLEFARISQRKDALSANLTARTAQDKKIEIVITRVGDGLTKVRIRVGVFGDEALSLAILDKIKANL
jgi:hypothetical protein